jgi:hypothetical protein
MFWHPLGIQWLYFTRQHLFEQKQTIKHLNFCYFLERLLEGTLVTVKSEASDQSTKVNDWKKQKFSDTESYRDFDSIKDPTDTDADNETELKTKPIPKLNGKITIVTF